MEPAMTELLSDAAYDKLRACLNQSRAESDYAADKDYYDACIEWHRSLTPVQQQIVLEVIEAHVNKLPNAAEKLASLLPAAPQYVDRTAKKMNS
jgi:hypothetical protein